MDIYNILNKLNIKYEEVEHEAIFTVNDASKLEINKMLEGIECKNLFVKSKNNYYLIFTGIEKKVDLKFLAKSVNESRFSFASIVELKEILNSDIGSVTPLSIINDKSNRVILIIDSNLQNKRVLVHSNTNTKTLSLKYDDLLKYIEYTKHRYFITDTSNN